MIYEFSKDIMSEDEKQTLYYLLDKFMRTVPLCSGKCEKCLYGVNSRLEGLINSKCPLHITRDMLKYRINEPWKWEEIRG